MCYDGMSRVVPRRYTVPTVPPNESTMSQLPTARRTFLKASGVSMALPMLDSTRAKAASESARTSESDRSGPAKRLVCVGTYLGFYQKAFYPEQSGFDYETSELLKPLEHLRDQLTVFSGLDHRDGNGHKKVSRCR